MELLELFDKAIADHIQTPDFQERADHHVTDNAHHRTMKGSLADDTTADAEEICSSDLSAFQSRARGARTIENLVCTLKDFSQGDWTLGERATISSAYTPVAIKLLATENLDRGQTLEALAALCWTRSPD